MASRSKETWWQAVPIASTWLNTVGIAIRGRQPNEATGNRVEGCVITGVSQGVSIRNADGNLLKNSLIHDIFPQGGTAPWSISVRNSASGNRIVGNHLADGDPGIVLDQSSATILTGNSIIDHGSAFEITSSTYTLGPDREHQRDSRQLRRRRPPVGQLRAVNLRILIYTIQMLPPATSSCDLIWVIRRGGRHTPCAVGAERTAPTECACYLKKPPATGVAEGCWIACGKIKRGGGPVRARSPRRRRGTTRRSSGCHRSRSGTRS